MTDRYFPPIPTMLPVYRRKGRDTGLRPLGELAAEHLRRAARQSRRQSEKRAGQAGSVATKSAEKRSGRVAQAILLVTQAEFAELLAGSLEELELSTLSELSVSIVAETWAEAVRRTIPGYQDAELPEEAKEAAKEVDRI